MMTTRWAMSYLRGPLTRDQIGQAMAISAAAPPLPRPRPPPAAARRRHPPRAGRSRAGRSRPAAAVPVRADDVTASGPAARGRCAAARRRCGPRAGDRRCRRVAGDADARRRRAGGLRRSRGAVAAARRRRTRWSAPACRGGRARRPHLRRGHRGRAPPRSTRRSSCRCTQVPDPRLFVAVDYDDRDLVPAAPAGAVYGLVPSEAKAKTYWTALQKSLVDELVRATHHRGHGQHRPQGDAAAGRDPRAVRRALPHARRRGRRQADDRAAHQVRVEADHREGQGDRRADQRAGAAAGVRRQLRPCRHRHLGARQPARRPPQPLVDGGRRAPSVRGEREGGCSGADEGERAARRSSRSSRSSSRRSSSSTPRGTRRRRTSRRSPSRWRRPTSPSATSASSGSPSPDRVAPRSRSATEPGTRPASDRR